MMFKVFSNLIRKILGDEDSFKKVYAQLELETCDDIGCEAFIGERFTVNMEDLFHKEDYVLFRSNDSDIDLSIFCDELKTVYDETIQKCRYYLNTASGNYVFRYVGVGVPVD